MFQFLVVVSIVNIAIYLGLAILVLRVWQHGKAQRRFFFLLVTSAGWLATHLLDPFSGHNLNLYTFVNRLNFALAALVGYFFLIFAFHFPKEEPKLSSKKEIILSIPILILIIFIFQGLLCQVEGYNNFIYNVPIYLVYIVVLISYFVILGASVLAKKYKNSTGLLRLQLKYFILGYIISISTALYFSIHNALIRILPKEPSLIWSNIVIIFALLTTYSILRYRLMDIRVILKKSLIYLISLGLAAGVYTYLALIFTRILKLSFDISTVIIILLVALGFPLIKIGIERLVNTIFREKRARKELEKLKKKLVTQVDLAKLAGEIAKEIYRVLGVQEVKFLLYNKKENVYALKFPPQVRLRLNFNHPLLSFFRTYKRTVVKEEIPSLLRLRRDGELKKLKTTEAYLAKFKVTLALPLVSDQDLLGLILLGDKENKEGFTIEDIEFLENLALESTLAFGNAMLYQETIEGVLKRSFEK